MASQDSGFSSEMSLLYSPQSPSVSNEVLANDRTSKSESALPFMKTLIKGKARPVDQLSIPVSRQEHLDSEC